MMAEKLDGKQVAAEIREEVGEQVKQFVASGAPAPCLAAVLVGEDPASQVYVRNKARACEKAGIEGRTHRLPADAGQKQLLELVNQLNADPTVNGILVQLPLPSGQDYDEREILDAVDPLKDVDAFSPVNVGLLMQGRPRFLPCTPHGIVQLLHRAKISCSGKKVCVVGRSDIVGKPMAMMLAQKSGSCGPDVANATVTLAHSRTADLAATCRDADILIAAVGRPEMITADMIKPGAVVIDVGINRVGDKLVGDVDYAGACEVASAITPVPGGVGPLTIAMLLHNTLMAAKLQSAS
ncbi:bifunctional methylenetetrahydrofolate dehydrogenase/methenyltetrahydrofolate cyclohydrolase FolD [Rhodopirellula sp. MGV]|uniref:bifunctional methylenetetrahydrofolate dehydrogenase/methenyltetrahydrofolate cyclohydrolase FolD n=1 Tax=Rhodopirellula sp. MGV TaxID=2023130 RepID=UPI000B962460|nr:bifunctional methylenetetrahydrofolate dehydrogenase/methenyltetrahydrofolate cyclohydrolase FolD [Rhodopirellula sp. MGV]OYP37777.1 bifunctional 5,10-methylene-tetrahydrofolate dehydrogenase/5,10-methylene-tetrahydrofolate cyclohydrolase [Rhodopirellula sp. MGV]PNY37198.1 bifunctional methylenetetrahydrofolate dehydrogenase/methenyltetrahydrofolate cyclohydrolase FolD [Rhodopirellula baltica]